MLGFCWDRWFAHSTGLFASILFGSVLLPGSAVAQENGYEEWVEQQQQEYEEYLSEQDQAFLKFLKKEWEDVHVDAPVPTPIDEKPQQIPRPDEDSSPAVNRGSSMSGAENPGRTRRASENTPSDLSNGGSESEMEEMSEGPDLSSRDESSLPDDKLEEAVSKAEEESLGPESPAESLSAEPASSEDTESRNPVPEEAASNLSGSPDGASPSPEEEPEAAAVDQEASLSFFGTTTTVPFGAALLPSLEGAPDKASIRSFWEAMAKAPHGSTLEAAQRHRENLGLGDWGYYRYLENLSTQLYGDAEANEQVLWTWFMMMKSGYAARVAHRGGRVFLMLPVKEKVFGWPQMRVDGQRYYLMTDEVEGSLRTYEGQHEEASRALRLNARSLPDFSRKSETRTVSFSFQGERHKLEIARNPSVVDYLQEYPNVDLQVLFEAGISSVAQGSIADALGPLLEGHTPRESLNLLLKFSQFATDYKRDQDHFGEERYLFPEETLASDYSDCEDRAVLMAYLTRELLDREVVGLKWPSHVALAVRATEGLVPAQNDRTVSVGGATYIFADPTYIGSSVGMEMPMVEGKKPEIISIRE